MVCMLQHVILSDCRWQANKVTFGGSLAEKKERTWTEGASSGPRVSQCKCPGLGMWLEGAVGRQEGEQDSVSEGRACGALQRLCRPWSHSKWMGAVEGFEQGSQK